MIIASSGSSERPTKTVLRLSTRSAIALLVALYTAAWGGLLFSSSGVYWDDWIYVSVPHAEILQMTRELGLPWIGYLLLVLLRLGPITYHVLSLLLFLSVGLTTLGILRRVPFLTPNEQIFVAGLVLVLPLMAARNVLSVEQYALSYALFYLAWYFLIRESAPRMVTVWTAAILFTASFTTSSLLVFFVMPMFHLWYQAGFRAKLPVKRFLLRYWPLLLLPVAWYAAKLLLFEPYGRYLGYNQITSRSFVHATALLAEAAIPLGAVYIVRGRLQPQTLKVLGALSAGLFLTVLAIYPYVAVDKGPPFIEWETRNELLMPLGIAFIVLAICRTLRVVWGRRMAQLFAIAVLAGSVLSSAGICSAYFVDWQKQQSLIEVFRATPTLARASSVVFRDNTRSMNIFSRRYRFYEWNGLMLRAFGEQTRFGVNDAGPEIQRLLTGQYRRFAVYGARAYVADDSVLRVTITAADASEPWYVYFPYLSHSIPTSAMMQIQTTLSTRAQALKGG